MKPSAKVAPPKRPSRVVSNSFDYSLD
ncbi:DUF4385 domain-containing protein, partial [Yersinia pestis]